jgi:inosine-uridine nucleoside N-ribohydrolase
MYYANEEYEQLMKAQVMETGRSQLSFHGAFDTSRFRRGNIFTVRDPIRDEVGALILSSRNVRLQNMGMHYMHGLGILSQYSENIFMDSVMVEPRKGSGRRIASFADGMHFSGCKGTIRIAHCRFNGLHDDAINVHGTHLQIVEKRSGNQWVLRFMHPQTYGFQAFREKDSIAFVHPATLGMFAEGRVQHVLRLSDREILLTFDKAAPSSVAVGDVVENTTWTPRVIVRNCLITGSNTRGILVTTRRKVIIEGNEFRRLGMQAILIADDALSWYESGPVKDVLIRNNTFTNCGHLIRPAYAIVIAPENHQLTDTPVHRNIRIENNRFSGSSDAVMAARSVEGLTFINNTVRYMEPDDPAARYLLVACRKGTIRNNHYRQAQQKAPVPIILDTDIGPDYDDVGAVAILHALADKGECRPLAIMASNKHPLVGPAIDILNIYFGRPNLPIGAPKGADAPDKGAKQKWPEMLVKKYPHHINATAELPDAVALYRKILAAAPDTSVTIVTVGFLTNLAHLLESKADGYSSLPGAALIRKKVKRLVSMAGRFPEGREYNVLIDSAASEKVFLHWPTPVIYSGFEIGREIITGRELIANEKLQSPVKDVFALSMAFSPEDHDGRMSWDETAVLVAIRGVDPYFGQHRGRIILKGGSNEWIDDPQGDQAYLTMKMPAEELRAIIELMMMTASSK